MHLFNQIIDDNTEKQNVEIEHEEENTVDEEGDSGDDASGSDNDVDSDEENLGSSDNEGEEDGDNEDSDEEHGHKQTLKKPQKLSDVKEGKTLFIRNLSFDSTEEALHELFEQFGEIDYCKLMEDKRTGHSRGMAFVKFKTVESAEQCLAEATKEGSGKKISVDQGWGQSAVYVAYASVTRRSLACGVGLQIAQRTGARS